MDVARRQDRALREDRRPHHSSPVLVDDPATPGQQLHLASDGTAYAHGFLIVELNDDQKSAVVNYYQSSAPGVPMYTETL